MKNFNVSFDVALNDIPYINILMYSRTLPDYDYDSKDKGGGGNKGSGRNLLELEDENFLNL